MITPTKGKTMISSMNNIAKYYFFFLLGIFVTTFYMVQGNEPFLINDNCFVVDDFNNNICDFNSCGCQHQQQWSATFLYERPNIDDTHFVLDSSNNTFNTSHYPKGKRYQNTASWAPGFKVEGLFDICPNTSSLDLCFTYLTANARHSISGEFLYDTNGYPGFGSQDSPIYAGTARSKNSYNYYAGDITYNRAVACFCPENFRFIVGLHVAYIRFKEHTTSIGTISTSAGPKPLFNNMHRNSKFYGVGPQVGMDYEFLMSNWLNGKWALVAKARGMLLYGETKSDLRFVTLRTGPSGVGVRNGDLWRVVPGASADLGINYSLNCMWCVATIEVGYDFTWYSDCVNKITGLDVAFAGDTIDVFNSFSLQGPYLRISTSF